MTTARYFLRNCVQLADGMKILAGTFVTTRLGEIAAAGGALLSDNDITRSANALLLKLQAQGADVNTLDMTAQYETRQWGSAKGDAGQNGEGVHTFNDLAACEAGPSSGYVENDVISFPGFTGTWSSATGAGFTTDAVGLTCIKPDDVLVGSPGRIYPTTTTGKVANIAGLQAIQQAIVEVVHVADGAAPGDGFGGLFHRRAGDTTSVHNGYSIVVGTPGIRWHRQSHSKERSPLHLDVAFDAADSVDLRHKSATDLGTEVVITRENYLGCEGGSLTWTWDAALTAAGDDSGLIAWCGVARGSGTLGGWRARWGGGIDIRWFGGFCNNSTINTGIYARIDAAFPAGQVCVFIPGFMKTSDILYLAGRSHVTYRGLFTTAGPTCGIFYTGTDDKPFDLGDSAYCGLEDLYLFATNNAWAGGIAGRTGPTAVSCDSVYGCAAPRFINCMVGSNGTQWAARGISLINTVAARIERLNPFHCDIAIDGVDDNQTQFSNGTRINDIQVSTGTCNTSIRANGVGWLIDGGQLEPNASGVAAGIVSNTANGGAAILTIRNVNTYDATSGTWITFAGNNLVVEGCGLGTSVAPGEDVTGIALADAYGVSIRRTGFLGTQVDVALGSNVSGYSHEGCFGATNAGGQRDLIITGSAGGRSLYNYANFESTVDLDLDSPGGSTPFPAIVFGGLEAMSKYLLTIGIRVYQYKASPNESVGGPIDVVVQLGIVTDVNSVATCTVHATSNDSGLLPSSMAGASASVATSAGGITISSTEAAGVASFARYLALINRFEKTGVVVS
jgi:hypothetical protein